MTRKAKSANDYFIEIEDLVGEDQGPYTHNLISSILRCVAEKWGNEKANEMVDYFGLTELYGIHRVE
jgi:hypothetical protein